MSSSQYSLPHSKRVITEKNILETDQCMSDEELAKSSYSQHKSETMSCITNELSQMNQKSSLTVLPCQKTDNLNNDLVYSPVLYNIICENNKDNKHLSPKSSLLQINNLPSNVISNELSNSLLLVPSTSPSPPPLCNLSNRSINTIKNPDSVPLLNRDNYDVTISQVTTNESSTQSTSNDNQKIVHSIRKPKLQSAKVNLDIIPSQMKSKQSKKRTVNNTIASNKAAKKQKQMKKDIQNSNTHDHSDSISVPSVTSKDTLNTMNMNISQDQSLSSSVPEDVSSFLTQESRQKQIIDFEDYISSLHNMSKTINEDQLIYLQQLINQLKIFSILNQVADTTIVSLYPILKPLLCRYLSVSIFDLKAQPSSIIDANDTTSLLCNILDSLHQYVSLFPALSIACIIVSTPSLSPIIYDDELIEMIIQCHQRDINNYIKYMDILFYCHTNSIKKSIYHNKQFIQSISQYFNMIITSISQVHSLLLNTKLSSSLYIQLNSIYSLAFMLYNTNLFSMNNLLQYTIRNKLLLYWSSPSLQTSFLDSLIQSLPLYKENKTLVYSSNTCTVNPISMFIIQSIQGNILNTFDNDKSHFKIIQQRINYIYNTIISYTPLKQDRNETDAYSLFLKIFIHDLFILLDNSLYPICSSFLFILINKLVSYITSPTIASTINTTGSNANIYLKITTDLLVSIIIRIQKDNQWLALHPYSLPLEVERFNTSGLPGEDGEVIGCKCGKNIVTSEIMFDCDRCHRWFHASCAGVNTRLYTPASLENIPWFCSDCQAILKMKNQFNDIQMHIDMNTEFNAQFNKQDINTKQDKTINTNNNTQPTSLCEQQQLLLNYITSLTLSSSSTSQFISSNSRDSAVSSSKEHSNSDQYLYNHNYHARQYYIYSWLKYSAETKQLEKKNKKIISFLKQQLSIPSYFDKTKYSLPPLSSLSSLTLSLLSLSPLYQSLSVYISQFISITQQNSHHIRLFRSIFSSLITLLRASPSLLNYSAILDIIREALHSNYISLREQALTALSLLCNQFPQYTEFYIKLLEELLQEGSSTIRKLAYKNMIELYDHKLVEEKLLKRVVYILMEHMLREQDTNIHELLTSFYYDVWMSHAHCKDALSFIRLMGSLLSSYYKQNYINKDFDSLISLLLIEGKRSMTLNNSLDTTSTSIQTLKTDLCIKEDLSISLKSLTDIIMDTDITGCLHMEDTTQRDEFTYNDFVILYFISSVQPKFLCSFLDSVSLYLSESLNVSELINEQIQVLVMNILNNILRISSLEPIYNNIGKSLVTIIKTCKLQSTIDTAVHTLTSILFTFSLSTKPLLDLIQTFLSYIYIPSTSNRNLYIAQMNSDVPIKQRCLTVISSILSYYPFSICDESLQISVKDQTIRVVTLYKRIASIYISYLKEQESLDILLQIYMLNSIIKSSTLYLKNYSIYLSYLKHYLSIRDDNISYSIYDTLYRQMVFLLESSTIQKFNINITEYNTYIFDIYNEIGVDLQHCVLSTNSKLKLISLLLIQKLILYNYVYSISYVYPLTLLQTDPNNTIRRISLELLIYMYEKYKELTTNNLTKSILDSYRYNRKYNNNEVCYIYSSNEGMEPLYSNIYIQIYSKQRKEKNNFIKSILAVLDSRDLSSILYIFTLLSAFRFSYTEDILYILYILNTYKTAIINPLEVNLIALVDEPIDKDKYMSSVLSEESLISFNQSIYISLMILSFKAYLRTTYSIQTEMCNKFEPESSSNPQTHLSNDSGITPYKFTLCIPKNESITQLTLLDSIQLFFTYLHKDDNDIFLNTKLKSKRKGKKSLKRKRKSTKKSFIASPLDDIDEIEYEDIEKEEEEEEEMEDDDDDDDSILFEQTSISPRSEKRSQRRSSRRITNKYKLNNTSKSSKEDENEDENNIDNDTDSDFMPDSM